jgi:acyl-CoA synthetase (AMP-forming)/AMP-acid ligase II
MSMRPKLVFQGQVIGADDFEQRWRRSAAALQAAGVGDGDIVALLMRNSPEAIELMIATRHLGAQWCPVNWHFKTEEVQYILANSGAKVFIADAALLEALHDLDTQGLKVWTTRGTLPACRPGSRCAMPRADRRAGGGAARRDVLHLGHHRPAQGHRARTP